MAAGIINLQKASGGITKISGIDGTGTTQVVVPESGTLATLDNLDINSLTNKGTPINTDVIQIQETGGLFKKLSWANLKATLFNGAMSLTAKGYIKFPTVMGGLIIQWGTAMNDNSYAVGFTKTSFPISFPNACFVVLPTGETSQGSDYQKHGAYVFMKSINNFDWTAFYFNGERITETNRIIIDYIAIGR